jgi:hypothetical protein
MRGTPLRGHFGALELGSATTEVDMELGFPGRSFEKLFDQLRLGFKQ